MRILNCHVENFGKLKEFDYDFEKETTYICAHNGWGKSTLAAFLRIMFFGFEGARKQSDLENERKRFMPWQGGVYGGRISFETNGKSYLMTRTFGKKDTDDFFELRDLETNLISNDFSSNIGEELFSINSESFCKTVFIGQDDTILQDVNDNVQAKIGNLADDANDIDCFEKASKSLKDFCNSLTPRRATGEIKKLRDRETGLVSGIRATESLDFTLKAAEKKVRDEEEALKNYSDKKKELEEELKKISHEKDIQKDREAYRLLCRDKRDKNEILQKYRLDFPNGIPDEGLLEELSNNVKNFEKQATTSENYNVNADAGDIVKRTEDLFGENPDPAFIAKEVYDKVQLWQQRINRKMEIMNLKSQLQNKQALDAQAKAIEKPIKKRSLIWLLIAIAIVVAAIIMLIAGKTSFGIVYLIGAAVVFIFYLKSDVNKKKKAKEEELEPEVSPYREEEEAILKAEAQVNTADDTMKEFFSQHNMIYEEEKVSEKLQDLRDLTISYATVKEKLSAKERAENQKKELKEYIRKELLNIGIVPEDNDFSRQIQSIRDKAFLARNAEKDYVNIRNIVKEFEEKHNNEEMFYSEDMFITLGGLDAEPLEDSFTMGDLQERYNEVCDAMDEAKSRIASYLKECGDLEDAIDHRNEDKVELENLREEIEEKLTAYKAAEKASEFLVKAKASLTMKYTKPLMDSFGKYYTIVASEGVDKYHMDADTRITVDEEGAQRNVAFLSTGYRDFIGVCERLALIDAMYTEEKPFLIMDDPFVNFDDIRTKGAKKLLSEVGKDYQVIYFTCNEMRSNS